MRSGCRLNVEILSTHPAVYSIFEITFNSFHFEFRYIAIRALVFLRSSLKERWNWKGLKSNLRQQTAVSFNSHKIWFHSIRRIMTSVLSLKTDTPEFDTRSELGATTSCSFLASDPNKRIPNWLLDRLFELQRSPRRDETSFEREKKTRDFKLKRIFLLNRAANNKFPISSAKPRCTKWQEIWSTSDRSRFSGQSARNKQRDNLNQWQTGSITRLFVTPLPVIRLLPTRASVCLRSLPSNNACHRDTHTFTR